MWGRTIDELFPEFARHVQESFNNDLLLLRLLEHRGSINVCVRIANDGRTEDLSQVPKWHLDLR